MRFDWQRFCSDYRIHFETQGPNTAKGNISIKCPWCGSADESEHMGLSLDQHKPWYACWRSQMHRGKDPSILVAKLMGWPLTQARVFIEDQQGNPDDFEAALSSLSQGRTSLQETRGRKILEMPKDFRTFKEADEWSVLKRFASYLFGRGFEKYMPLVERYDLRWAVTGDYRHRIIVPVKHSDGTLATWTSRAIGPAALRYKSLDDNQGMKYVNYRNVKDCLLFHRDSLQEPQDRVLIVAEGPFDALKLDYLLFEWGFTATCLFGVAMSQAQLVSLSRIGRLFKSIVVLLDATATTESSIIVSQLQEVIGGGVRQGRLPSEVKDPGQLSRLQVGELLKLNGLRRSVWV